MEWDHSGETASRHEAFGDFVNWDYYKSFTSRCLALYKSGYCYETPSFPVKQNATGNGAPHKGKHSLTLSARACGDKALELRGLSLGATAGAGARRVRSISSTDPIWD